jgi:hypothetical protein
MTPTSELSVESDGAPRLFDGANAMVMVALEKSRWKRQGCTCRGNVENEKNLEE